MRHSPTGVGISSTQRGDALAGGIRQDLPTIIPLLVEEHDGTRSYIHGSPYDANWGNTEKFASSDVHDWGLWYGHLPLKRWQAATLASEFSFQSFPR